METVNTHFSRQDSHEHYAAAQVNSDAGRIGARGFYLLRARPISEELISVSPQKVRKNFKTVRSRSRSAITCQRAIGQQLRGLHALRSNIIGPRDLGENNLTR